MQTMNRIKKHPTTAVKRVVMQQLLVKETSAHGGMIEITSVTKSKGSVTQKYVTMTVPLNGNKVCTHCIKLIPVRSNLAGDLKKMEVEPRQVTVDRAGHFDCDCEDHIYSRKPVGRHCKHILALSGLGLIPECKEV